jgi:hypothetical protein
LITNKLANELLECSIIFYNYWVDNGINNFDPYDDANKIAKYAKSIGHSGQELSRINEAINSLEEIHYKFINEATIFIDQILNVYEQVEIENSQNLWSSRRAFVDEEKIINVAKEVLNDEIIKEIALSRKDNLINDFYKSLNELISKISNKNIDFFIKKKTLLIKYLPINNKIKINHKISKLIN